jgi:1-acyl-sn-glycerol-3-phosphate acyltransferase
MIQRRVVSLSVLAVVTTVAVSTAPMLLLLGIGLSLLPQFRSLPHAMIFAFGFLYFECLGVLRLTWVWLWHRHGPNYLQLNQHIQYWWAGGLLRLGVKIYDLDIQIHGVEAIEGPSALLIARHTSIGDTVLPMLYFAEHRGEGLRYILKQELTIMPCLDIAGHRLPNLFVDRSGIDTEAELRAVRKLTQAASAQESVLIYPEGTRFTPEKQQRLLETKPQLREQLQRWPNLLPPKLGGVSAMLDANPGKDVVFLAHTGFEGSASLHDLVNGSWRRQKVRLHFWRIAYPDIPADHQTFIFSNWDTMQKIVSESV